VLASISLISYLRFLCILLRPCPHVFSRYWWYPFFLFCGTQWLSSPYSGSLFLENFMFSCFFRSISQTQDSFFRILLCSAWKLKNLISSLTCWVNITFLVHLRTGEQIHGRVVFMPSKTLLIEPKERNRSSYKYFPWKVPQGRTLLKALINTAPPKLLHSVTFAQKQYNLHKEGHDTSYFRALWIEVDYFYILKIRWESFAVTDWQDYIHVWMH
jgi:hypothetical protein